MTDVADEQLERPLAALTRWEGRSPKLWNRALVAAGLPRKRISILRRSLHWRSPIVLLGGAAAAVLLIVAFATQELGLESHDFDFFYSLRPDRSSDRTEPVAAPAFNRSIRLQEIWNLAGSDLTSPSWTNGFYYSVTGGRFGEGQGSFADPFGETTVAPAALARPRRESSDVGSITLSSERHVVRKATIELKTDDVRAAFVKVAHIISEANGEYLQDSSLTGSGETAQANLTLRVAADRLSEVLNRLRELGEVYSERTVGEDVTTQVVDLEARLRNESRVEAELLELLETRKDARLDDILKLRGSLAGVRDVIERLTAQRERLGRLVSLATVLVIIRAEDAPPPEQPGIGAYFGRSMRSAWDGGLSLLVATIAGFLRVLLGGLVWWGLLVAAVLLIRRALRRAEARRATAS